MGKEKLVYTDSFGNVYSIEAYCGFTIYNTIDELFKPILRAAGVHESLILEIFCEEELDETKEDDKS